MRSYQPLSYNFLETLQGASQLQVMVMTAQTIELNVAVHDPLSVSVEVTSTTSVVLATLQTQQYSSCVSGSFSGLKVGFRPLVRFFLSGFLFQADGVTPCSVDEKHTYPAEINVPTSYARILQR